MQPLEDRICRLYAAIGETMERDLSKFPPVSRPGEGLIFAYSFGSGLSDAQIANVAHTAIHAIAHLGDHLKRFAKEKSLEPSEVDKVIKGSMALKILIDLSNNDKHGYPPRNGGWSSLAPRVDKLRKALRISAGPSLDSATSAVFTGSGVRMEGTGSGVVAISGNVLDGNGNIIDDVGLLLEAGAEAWEALLVGWGISLDKAV